MSYELTESDKALYVFEVSDLERLEDGQVIKKNRKVVKVKPKTYEHYKRLEAKQGRNVLFHGKAVEVLNDPNRKDVEELNTPIEEISEVPSSPSKKAATKSK